MDKLQVTFVADPETMFANWHTLGAQRLGDLIGGLVLSGIVDPAEAVALEVSWGIVDVSVVHLADGHAG